MSSNAYHAELGLERFVEPIRTALSQYAEISEGRVAFDGDQAALLEPTQPEKPYSARSVSEVSFDGETISNLYVLAFAPLDGTGDDTSFKLGEVNMGFYEGEIKFLPRSKQTVEAETHLTLASADKNNPTGDPILFAGNLRVIGFMGNKRKLSRTAYLGQYTELFLGAMDKVYPAPPEATYTVGYSEKGMTPDQRFGDPHAIYNPWKHVIQVCGFLAISIDTPQYAAALQALGSIDPTNRPKLYKES